MEQKYPDRWRGIKRLVGNRAQIFLENAVIMYYMARLLTFKIFFTLTLTPTIKLMHTLTTIITLVSTWNTRRLFCTKLRKATVYIDVLMRNCEMRKCLQVRVSMRIIVS